MSVSYSHSPHATKRIIIIFYIMPLLVSAFEMLIQILQKMT